MTCFYRATRALHFTGTNSMEQALNWIEEHETDPEADNPLLVPKVGLCGCLQPRLTRDCSSAGWRGCQDATILPISQSCPPLGCRKR